MQWVGLDNYTTLLTDPQTTRSVFLHTLYYIVGYLPLVYVGGLGLALALNQALRVAGTCCAAAYFLPVVTSWVVVALVWRGCSTRRNGVVNTVLGWFGIARARLVDRPAWAMPSIILASAWKDLGFVMVILLAGLQAIPPTCTRPRGSTAPAAWQRFCAASRCRCCRPSHLLRRRHLAHQRLPGLRPGVRDDRRRARRLEPGRRQQIYDLTFRYGARGRGLRAVAGCCSSSSSP